MTSRRPGWRLRRVVPLLALTLLLGACSALPESGPVHRGSRSDAQTQADSARFTAPGPGQGDAPIQIVNGFLTAMTANPAATSAARSFLSREARSSWNPVSSTLVYRSVAVTAGRGSTVDAVLAAPRRLDARGGWLGRAGARAGRLTMDVVKEGGEWRIANPPNALLVPEYFLEQEYEPFDLYFFDPTHRVLVPDRVYVPRGEQTASQLVRALLDGPGSALSRSLRSEFPAGTQLDLSVSVAPDGTAEVPLSRELLRLSSVQLRRAAAQLSWTLRQVPGITRIRLAVDNTPVPLSGGRDIGYGATAPYDPSVAGVPDQVFTLAKGRLAALDPGAGSSGPDPVSGAFGTRGYALRSFAVSLSGSTVTAVSGDGRSVRRTAVSRPKGGAAPVRTLYTGTDVLTPSYDVTGATWLVDRTSGGARVVVVSGDRARVVDVPGVTGRTVGGFLVNRSGTTLVATVARGDGRPDTVVSAELLRTAGGGLSGVTTARTNAALPSGMGPLVALAWRSPDDLAVLGRPAKGLSRVALISLDGSPGDPRTVSPDTWPGDATGLVGSPDPDLPLYLVTGNGRLRVLDASGLWRSTAAGTGQVAPAYLG